MDASFNHFDNTKIYTNVPAFKSEMTEGRMQMGGARTRVRIKSFGCPLATFIINKGTSCRILIKY